MTVAPQFSVVVPTYNRIAMLLRVLESLGRQENAPSFEVIVVNDGSSDDTVPQIDALQASGRISYPFHFSSQPNSGPGRARNVGVTLASGNFVIFIGDDTVPEPRFLSEHARTHQDTGHDPLVACLGYTGWPREERVTAFMDHINDYGLQFGYRLIEDGTVVPFNFFYTSNISMARETLATHPFETTFPSAAWEDIELAYRLDKLGMKIHYNARAVTRHYHQMTIDSFSRRQYTVGRSGAIFHRMHPELGHFLGVYEVRDRQLLDEAAMKRLRWRARIGEMFRPLARGPVFDALMREHYLHGLRAGLLETGGIPD